MVTCCGRWTFEAPQDGKIGFVENPARRTRTRVSRHTRAVRTVRGCLVVGLLVVIEYVGWYFFVVVCFGKGEML